jgi:hypothetical protein
MIVGLPTAGGVFQSFSAAPLCTMGTLLGLAVESLSRTSQQVSCILSRQKGGSHGTKHNQKILKGSENWKNRHSINPN